VVGLAPDKGELGLKRADRVTSFRSFDFSESMPMKPAVRALRHRNFRLLLSGQLVAYIGIWIQQIAMSWLVYRLTGSAFLLGLTGFASQIAILFFAPFGGLWADRFNRRRLLLTAQSIAMVQALLLAYLVWSGLVAVWHIIFLALLLGLVDALEKPVRQSFFVELVDRQDLPNAIALNSFVFNSGRFLGPFIAGILLSAFGEVVCFLINGVGYAAAMGALLQIRVPRREMIRHSAGLLQRLKEGVSYALGFPPTRALLTLVAAMSFTITPYTVLMPIFAAEVFGGGAATLGYLMGAAGVGALAAAAYLATCKSVRGLANPTSTVRGAEVWHIKDLGLGVATTFVPWKAVSDALVAVSRGIEGAELVRVQGGLRNEFAVDVSSHPQAATRCQQIGCARIR
jgi:MFS family permease